MPQRENEVKRHHTFFIYKKSEVYGNWGTCFVSKVKAYNVLSVMYLVEIEIQIERRYLKRKLI